MNNWKETAWLWFTRAGQFWLAQTLIIYLWACVVASKPIGPKDYVKFNYHVIQWNPRNAPALPHVEASIYGKRN
jgi:hypothetical protein